MTSRKFTRRSICSARRRCFPAPRHSADYTLSVPVLDFAWEPATVSLFLELKNFILAICRIALSMVNDEPNLPNIVAWTSALFLQTLHDVRA